MMFSQYLRFINALTLFLMLAVSNTFASGFVCHRDDLNNDGDFRHLEVLQQEGGDLELRYTQKPGGYFSSEKKYDNILLASGFHCTSANDDSLIQLCEGKGSLSDSVRLTKVSRKEFTYDRNNQPASRELDSLEVSIGSEALATDALKDFRDRIQEWPIQKKTLGYGKINFPLQFCKALP